MRRARNAACQRLTSTALHALDSCMAPRSIASLSLTFGLVSIPVKLYSATEHSAAVRFKLMSKRGARLRQHYVADTPPAVEFEPPEEPAAAPSVGTRIRSTKEAAPAVAEHGPKPPTADLFSTDGLHIPDTERNLIERDEMVKGYEYEKGKFVLFSAAELEALRAQSRETIDIVSFIPAMAVDPLFYDKAYLLAPGKRGERTYSLLLRALERSQRSALAKWAWKNKEYVVQIRATDGGLVLQQLLYADEVRTPSMLQIELVAVGQAELQLALQLIEQGQQHAYDPHQFFDEEKLRILEMVDRKIAGRRTVTHAKPERLAASGEVVNLLEALRASLQGQAKREQLPPRKPVVRAVPPAAQGAVGKPAAPRKARTSK
jgi:DNA end-binding protein Ku